MNLHELYPYPQERVGSKRVGRGQGSGFGGTSGKGHKGQNARSGGGVPAHFEGGQMPLYRRLPKRGFKNPFAVTYQPINLSALLSFFPEKDEITIDDIYARGLAGANKPIKILGDGEVSRPVTVLAHKFSKQAAAKIVAAGGQANSIEG
ncbi:MAG: 50S ribosomal protein L15 [Desulfomicrobium sp.]|jgi:large subunit ribosomal protein L15|nr:50S ribosomal protein L15 [Desulfomicrobium sp.]NLV97894.1 50S ribosomal protein L15 [Desulfovibrionales bacterium]